MEKKLICAGLGGQGVLMIGQLIGYAATLDETKQVSFYPSYGFEMRGGSADCFVAIGDQKIGSVLFRKADYAIVMSEDAMKKYEQSVKPGGILFVNKSMVSSKSDRKDISVIYIDAQKYAGEAGSDRAVNLVMLGALIEKTGILSPAMILEAMNYKFKKLPEAAAEANKKAFVLGQNIQEM